MVGLLKKEKSFSCFIFISLGVYVAFVLSLLLANVVYVKWPDFIRVLLSPETFFAVKLSLFTSIITTLLAVFFAVPGGYVLSRYDFPGKAVIDTIIDIPMVLPPLIVGVSLLVFFNTGLGNFIEKYGFRFVFTVPGIILAQFAISSSFAVRAMKAAYDNIDPKYELTARSLGCSRFQAFYKVVIPLSRSGLIAGVVMTWARAVGEFVPILIFCGAMRFKTEILPTAIFLHLEMGDIQGAVGLTLVMMLISVIALLIFKKAE